MHTSANEFHAALAALDRPRIEALFRVAVREHGPTRAIEDLMVPALTRLGREWDSGEIALSQIYMSSRICEDIVDEALPPTVAERKSAPRVAIAVLADYHMLGKRIVLSVMRASGIEVADFGRMDVAPLVERIVAEQVEILLLSVLMLPAALKVKTLRAELAARGVQVRIAVGGAPFFFDPELWREVGADAVGHNAAEAVDIVRRWQKERP